MMMQETDRCQDNDESYRQILHLNEHFNFEQDRKIKIILITNRFHFILFICLFLTPQSNALPIPQINYNQPGRYIPPVAMVQLTQQNNYKIYRRFPNNIPSYSNGAVVQIYDQTNQQELRRERQRRTMIDKLITLFDEDGNGQLAKDELYSMALRSNMFPKFHYYLKQTSSSNSL